MNDSNDSKEQLDYRAMLCTAELDLKDMIKKGCTTLVFDYPPMTFQPNQYRDKNSKPLQYFKSVDNLLGQKDEAKIASLSPKKRDMESNCF